MARIFMDGFESGNLNWWVVSETFVDSSSPPAGFSGSYYLRVHDANWTAYTTLNSSKAELYFAFKYMLRIAGTPSGIISFYDSAGTVIGGLYRESATGLPTFRLGGGGAAIQATGTTVINTFTVYLIEIRYKPLNSGGILQLKINGAAMEINFSGDSTAGLENIIKFGWFHTIVSTACCIDDFVVDDANWIGNTKIQALVPTGAGATTGWTPSTGDNYAAVDEKPALDTDYIKTGSSQIDTYAMQNLSGSIASIKSVAVQSRNWRTGNGSYDRGQHIVRPASTDGLSASKTSIFPITATSFQSIWELNPEDSAAWEEADVNGMEAGIKAVTA